MSFRHTTVCSLLGLLLATAPAGAASARQDVILGPVKGKVLDILDGDTVTARIHVWIGQDVESSVRIAGIDAPEIKGKCIKEREMAERARQALKALLADSEISLYNIRLEKYAGRVLAEAVNKNGVNISKHMLEKGLVRPYGGEKREGWCS